VTPLTIVISLFSLASLSKKTVEVRTTRIGSHILAPLSSDFFTVSGTIQKSDARVEIIRQYLNKYDSPLLPYAETIVSTADQYQVDFRLTTAIAMQESGLCKSIPKGTFNCWGWGIHSRGTLGFSSYEEGIRVVTSGLSSGYLTQGLDTPEKIMSKYAPYSNGMWAEGVKQFLSELE